MTRICDRLHQCCREGVMCTLILPAFRLQGKNYTTSGKEKNAKGRPLRKATKVHVYVQCFSFFPSLRGLTKVWHHNLIPLSLKNHSAKPESEVFHGHHTGSNICHHEMGPVVTQDFTVPKLAILAGRYLH